MVSKLQTFGEKVLASVIASAILATSAAGIATWAEVRTMRMEIGSLVEKQNNIGDDLKEVEKRVRTLEEKCLWQK